MKRLTRFSVSLDHHLLNQFDQLVTRQHYTNRSEALRDLIRNHLVEREWTWGHKTETVATITLVYSHDVRELSDTLIELQHRHHQVIQSAMHIHLDAHNCLEVLVVKGKSGLIRSIADRLIATRGVKHGKLTMMTTGKRLT